ncbi:MAG: winged helix-turn-helix transcriptional regulator [Candidatus Helarchaeota archaeon]
MDRRLKSNGTLSKKELSKNAGLSGKSLNTLLKKLQEENKIHISQVKAGKGRPRELIRAS